VSNLESPELSTTQGLASFTELGLAKPLLAAIAELGFSTPTPIQVQAIPTLLGGRDLVGVAQTGTGKTAAFGLPLLSSLDENYRAVQAIVLTPTRELALQVSDAISSFASHMDIEVLAVYGGSPYMPQQRALSAGVHVVVGTPGRVMDLMERGNLKLNHVKFVVLDEADEMLRMGFAEDVETIFAGVTGFKDDEVGRPQVALFSATMPPAIRAVADTHMLNPVRLAVTPQASTVESVTQSFAVVPFRHKTGALVRILETTDADATIVFCRTRSAAEEVGSALVERGISAATISGDVPQKERERIVERLKSGAVDVLVATDVAARGLDVERVGLVVNFDIPREPEAYVHRIGRTGRAGRSGKAISFINPGERNRLRMIEKTIGATISEYEIPSPKDVSAYKARSFLMQVAARRKSGRLEMYTDLVREQLLAGTDFNVVDPERAVDLAAVLLALAVGDDGPKARAEQEEFEAEQAAKRKTNEVREARRRIEDESGRKEFRRGDRDRDRDRDRGGRGDFDRGRDRGDRGERGDRGDRFGRSDRGRDFESRGRDDRGSRGGSGKGSVRYRVSVGHMDGVSPGGIVGAITGEIGLRGSDVGKIDIFPSFSLVDLNTPLSRSDMDRLSRATVSGRALRISEDRGGPPRGGSVRPKRERY
jgi:ATP-dependent RNA helicase DeaD